MVNWRSHIQADKEESVHLIVLPDAMVTSSSLVQDKLELANLAIPLDAVLPEHKDLLYACVAKHLRIQPSDIAQVKILSKRVDATDKSNVHFVVSLGISLISESLELSLFSDTDSVASIWSRRSGGSSAYGTIPYYSPGNALVRPLHTKPASKIYIIPDVFLKLNTKEPIVYGNDIASFIAALYLSKSGFTPTVLVAPFDKNLDAKDSYFDGWIDVHEETGLTQLVFNLLTEFGISEEVRVEAQPYVSFTDYLNFTQRVIGELKNAGVHVYSDAQILDIHFSAGVFCGLDFQYKCAGEGESTRHDACTVAGERSGAGTEHDEGECARTDDRAAHDEGTEHDAHAGTSEGSEHETISISANTLLFSPKSVQKHDYELLARCGFKLSQKPFPLGILFDFAPDVIEKGLYGSAAGHLALQSKYYRLGTATKNGDLAVMSNGAILIDLDVPHEYSKSALDAFDYQQRLKEDFTWVKNETPFLADFRKKTDENITRKLDAALDSFESLIPGLLAKNTPIKEVQVGVAGPVSVCEPVDAFSAVDGFVSSEHALGLEGFNVFSQNGVIVFGEGCGRQNRFMGAALSGVYAARKCVSRASCIDLNLLLDSKDATPSASTAQSHPAMQAQQTQAIPETQAQQTQTQEDLIFQTTKTFTDANNNEYEYIELNEKAVRIKSCKPAGLSLSMPVSIDNKTVLELDKRTFYDACNLEELVLPASLRQLLFGALSPLRNLKKLVMPAVLINFEVRALSSLSSLEELYLPDMLEKIPGNLLSACSPRYLHIGANTSAVGDNSFTHTKIKRVEVDARNPHLSSDGQALYSKDGTQLIAMVAAVENYTVLETCTCICHKAFAIHEQIRKVTFPDKLEHIEDFAFFRSNICEFTAPESLCNICTRAFAQCKNLNNVALNDNLKSIGDEAFFATPLQALNLPHSLMRVGKSFCNEAQLVNGQLAPKITLDERNETLFLDNEHAIYAKAPDGFLLMSFLDATIGSYNVLTGTVEIGANAFSGKQKLLYVVIPKSVKIIRKDAFKNCSSLRAVEGLEGVCEIEDGAFEGTNLDAINIPASLESFTENLFVIHNRGSRTPADVIPNINIDPDNERIFTKDGFICANGFGGEVVAMLYVGRQACAMFPECVNVVGPHCLAGAQHITKLVLHDGIRKLERGWTRSHSKVSCVEVHLRETTFQGRSGFKFYFPTHRGGLDDIRKAFDSCTIDIPTIFARSDEAMYWSHDLFLRSWNAVDRLIDPFMLSSVDKGKYEQLLKNHLQETFKEFITHAYLEGFVRLQELGYLTRDNIVDVIEMATEAGCVEVAGYLLELRRSAFGYDIMSDYDI